MKSAHGAFPASVSAVVTAGLKCAPKQLPSAEIITMRDAAMDQAPAGKPPLPES